VNYTSPEAPRVLRQPDCNSPENKQLLISCNLEQKTIQVIPTRVGIAPRSSSQVLLHKMPYKHKVRHFSVELFSLWTDKVTDKAVFFPHWRGETEAESIV